MSDGDDKQEAIGLPKHFMDYYGIYHHHKESMAWVATAFYIAGIIYAAFEARYFADDCSSWQIFFAMLFGLSGIIVLLFVGWQLWNRHLSAEWVKNCREQLMQTEAAKHINLDFRGG